MAKGCGLCLLSVPPHPLATRVPIWEPAPGSRVHLQLVWGRGLTICGPAPGSGRGCEQLLTTVHRAGSPAAQAMTCQPPPGWGGCWDLDPSAGVHLGHPHKYTRDSFTWLKLIAVWRMRKLRHRAAGRPLSTRARHREQDVASPDLAPAVSPALPSVTSPGPQQPWGQSQRLAHFTDSGSASDSRSAFGEADRVHVQAVVCLQQPWSL